MNKTLTFIIVSTINVFCFFVDSYSQNELYYWNQGKKVHIVEKANLYILYEGFDDNILNDSTIKLLQNGYSKYTGSYIIIETVKNLDCKNEFVHQSYVTEYRDTVFPTKNLLLKLSDEHSNNRLNEICEKYDLKILDTRYRVNKLQSKKNSEVFQIANTIYESEIEVDWCHPAFVEKQRLDFNPTQPIQLKKYFVDIQDTILSPLKQETLEEQGITIYPNPCKGNFYVDMNNNITEKTQIDIYTLQGEKVFSSYINHNQENIAFTKEKGVYIIKIKNEKIVWSGKIVLQ